MRILTRYLLRAHLGPFLFALVVLTGLLLINTVARRFEELVGKGLAASVVLEMVLLSLPHILALTLPMAVLVAVLYAFSQLAAENEFMALKASGVDAARLLAPLLVTAAVLTGLMVLFHDRVLPETNHMLKNLLIDIGRKSPTLELKEQVINEIQTGNLRTRYYLQAEEIEPATNRLRNIVIYDLSRAGETRTVYADSGRMAFNQERTDLFLTLYDGWIHELKDNQPATFQRLFFDRHLIRVAGVGDRFERSSDSMRGDREMSLAMLGARVEKGRRELAAVRAYSYDRSLRAVRRALHGPGFKDTPAAATDPGLPPIELGQEHFYFLDEPVSTDSVVRHVAVYFRGLKRKAESLEYEVNAFRVEYHKKLSIPFSCLVFVLIGAPLAVRFPRGGAGMVIAISLTIFSIYYMALTGGEELADKGMTSPVLAAWAPNLVFLGLGIWAVARFGRETSTGRGGRWDEWWDTLRGVLKQPAIAVRRRWAR